MANVVKYSTTAVANTIKKGNIVFGINNVEYGPTSSTGFWAGINPPTSGYTVYSFPGSGTTPTAVAPLNDSELISQAKMFGGTNILTTADALGYFTTGSPINVVVNKNYPDIVTSGMVLNYDASFVVSYPTAGTTWYDISGGGNNGTLTNGPTFSTFGNGSIICDGLDDYIISTLSGSSFPQSEGTISFWYYIPSLSGSTDFTDRGIFDGYDTSRNHFFIRNYQVPPNNLQIAAQSTDLTYKYVANFYVPNDVWHNIVFCYKTGSSSIARVYIDGVLNSDSTISSSSFVPNGQYVGFLTNATTSCKSGRYARLSLYNRVLSQSEVLQNYYQGNIVTSGLVMMLDAGNIVSYPTSGTTWYDLSGYGNHGTLINGPSFLSGARPSISLDGVNDKVDTPATLSGFTYNIHYDLNWTIETWMYVRTYDATPQSYKSIYGSYNGCVWNNKGNANGIYIYSTGAQNTIYLNFAYGPRNVAPASQCPDIQASWSNAEIGSTLWGLQNRWSHFALTSDDGTTLKLFVDGVQIGATKTVAFKNSQNRIDNTLAATSNYSWGGNQIGFNDVNFSICRMYNRALTSTEVLQNYNANKSNFN